MSNLHSFLPELKVFAPYHTVGSGGDNTGLQGFVPAIEDAALADSLHSIALANGAEEFRLELAARTEAMEARFKAELEAARKSWVEEVGEDLAGLISEALTGIEHRVGQSLQDIMLPFVDTLIPQAAVVEFMAILKKALQDDFEGALCLSGPNDMVAAVKDKLGSRKFEIVCEPSACLELRAKSKDFVISTRIKAWMDALHGDTP
jgi:hypothetical protein